MNFSIDGTELLGLENSAVELGSWERDYKERSVIGLDGLVSIDLGRRGRKIARRSPSASGSSRRATTPTPA